MVSLKPLRGAWSLHLCRGVVLALLVPFVSAASASADDPNASARDAELARLRGTWVVRSIMSNGEKIDDGHWYVFSGNKLVMEWAPGIYDPAPPRLYYDLELDPKADPKVIRLRPRGKTDEIHCTMIYRLQGDRLEICFNPNKGHEDKPPTKFDGSASSNQDLITLERVKEGKPKPK